MSDDQFPRTGYDQCPCGSTDWNNSRCVNCGETLRVEAVFTTVKDAAEILGVKYSTILYEAGRSGGTYQGCWVEKIRGRVYLATDDVNRLLRAKADAQHMS